MVTTLPRASKSRRTETQIRESLERIKAARERELRGSFEFFRTLIKADATKEEWMGSKDYQDVAAKFSRELSELERELKDCLDRTSSSNQSLRPRGTKRRYSANDSPCHRDRTIDQGEAVEVKDTLDSEEGDNLTGTFNIDPDATDCSFGIEGIDEELETSSDPDACSEEEELDASEVAAQLEKVCASNLPIELQGLRSKAFPIDRLGDSDAHAAETETIESQECVKGIRRGMCYFYQNPNTGVKSIVGVVKFLSSTEAECVLVVPFSDSFLGMADEGVDFKPNWQPCTHVQVHKKIDPILLHELGDECIEVGRIPELAYEPQDSDASSWYNFSYFYVGKRQRRGLRKEVRLVELFAGCGGMSQGFKNCNFKTCLAVEKDRKAAEAHRANHPEVPVECRDVVEVLNECKENPQKIEEIGRGGSLHLSPPCQGLSGANRNGGKNDKANNDLSYTMVEALKIFRPVVATYENVPGIWKRKHQHYLKNILLELLKMGYQVRFCQLVARDYGDPQARPRIFIFAALRCAELPRIPVAKYGESKELLPFVTVQDALEPLSAETSAKEATLPKKHDDDHEIERLDPHGTASTIRASAPLPYHYKWNRRINIREAAALFSFSPGYKFVGAMSDQRRQIGNSVPVGLATAVAESVREVLKYVYVGEDQQLHE